MKNTTTILLLDIPISHLSELEEDECLCYIEDYIIATDSMVYYYYNSIDGMVRGMIFMIEVLQEDVDICILTVKLHNSSVSTEPSISIAYVGEFANKLRQFSKDSILSLLSRYPELKEIVDVNNL